MRVSRSWTAEPDSIIELRHHNATATSRLSWSGFTHIKCGACKDAQQQSYVEGISVLQYSSGEEMFTPGRRRCRGRERRR